MQADCESLFQNISKIDHMSLIINNQFKVSFENLKIPKKFSFKTFLSNLLINFNENFENLSFKIQELVTYVQEFYFDLNQFKIFENSSTGREAFKIQISETYKTFHSSFKLFLEERINSSSWHELEGEIKKMSHKIVDIFKDQIYSRKNSIEMKKSFLKKNSYKNLDIISPNPSQNSFSNLNRSDNYSQRSSQNMENDSFFKDDLDYDMKKSNLVKSIDL